MLFTIFSVFYVVIAAAMIVLILMQRGDGANAGASFGGGASGTVFGARGSASFLTRTTAVLATLFFALTLGMGIYLAHTGVKQTPKQALGVMAGATTPAPPASVAATPAAAGSAAPASAPAAATNPEVPAASPASGTANTDVPNAPAAQPAASASAGGAPASH